MSHIIKSPKSLLNLGIRLYIAVMKTAHNCLSVRARS